MASVRKGGKIGLNQGTTKRYNLSDYQFVLLFYDKEDQKIGIDFTNDPNEAGAIKLKLNQSETAVSISAKAFFDFYQIDYSQTRRYDVVKKEGFQGVVLVEKQQNEGGEVMYEETE